MLQCGRAFYSAHTTKRLEVYTVQLGIYRATVEYLPDECKGERLNLSSPVKQGGE